MTAAERRKENQKMTTERLNELFDSRNSNLAICVGSWKAYTECNAHALGSCYNGHYYIDFEKLQGSEELYEVLEALGWSELECEELFVQDYEGEPLFKAGNCDYINPAHVADVLYDNDVDLDRDAQLLCAIMEYENCDLEEAIEKKDDYYFYEDMTAEEYEEQMIAECYPDFDFDKLGWLGSYITIDYEQMARDDDRIYETNGGVLVAY